MPYLVSRQGIPLAEAAAEFGITEAQLVKDLELLFVCGTPGHLPDDLIDVDWDDGHVFLSNADPIARPLRLDVDEALALLVGLRALADVPGLHDRDALRAHHGQARGGRRARPRRPAARSGSRSRRRARWPRSRRALAEGRRVHLTYFVPARDETTERDVDPMRVLLVDGRWYLEGWCRRAEDVRLFRLDRVDAITVLDAAGRGAAGRHRARPGGGPVRRHARTTSPVVLELAPPAHWVADYYPVD